MQKTRSATSWQKKLIAATLAVFAFVPQAFAFDAGIAPVVSNHFGYPNPYDPQSSVNYGNVTINYNLNTSAVVTVEILDGSAVIRNLGQSSQNSGANAVNWDGKQNGSYVAEKTYTYRITATNTYGTNIATGPIYVDYAGTPSGTAPVVTNDYATPNPFDPNTQVTTIYYTLNTAATVTVSILDGSTTVRNLGTTSVSAGVSAVSWDGKISGVNAAEKTYTYSIVATNSYGTDTQTGSVTVDYVSPPGTAPVISNDYVTPNPFNPNTTSTTLNYTLNTTANVTITILDGSTVIETLSNAGASKSSGVNTATWDGKDSSNNAFSNKTYTYRIDASNSSGSASRTGNVTVDTNTSNSAPTITSHYVTPSPFDPDEDSARINFSINKTADITVDILDGGTVIKTLTSGTSLSSGNYNYYWNGKDDDGDQVDNDTYTYRIRASNSYGTDTETSTVRVDDDDEDDNDDDNDDDIGNLINDINIDNATFDPDDDERAKLLFDVEEDNVDITVEILDGSKVIRTLVDEVQYDESNDNAVYWNGKDKDGDIVDDDVYRFRITAEKSGEDTETAYRYTEVDTDGVIIGFPDDNDDDENCAGFVDVEEDNPYCKAIELMKLKGIFAGYPDGTFRIYEPINRAETTKVVLLAIGYSIMNDDGSSLGFWDVVKNSWYMPYLRTAKNYGIIKGYPDNSFRPGNVPNRVELLKIFLEGTGINMPYCATAPFNDTPVSFETRWYIDYACFAANNALMYGDGAGNFNPAAPMNRGDVAMLFYNFYVRGLSSQMNPYYGYGSNTSYTPYTGTGYNY